MTIELKHLFQSSKGDGSDTSLVKPSNWNELHTFNITGPALVGKILSGAGAVEEIPLGAGLSFTDGILVATTRSLPIGVIFPLAGNYEPPGWFICDGRAVSRTTYSVLFDITGDKFGVGDGVTTFNVPDMRGRVPAGKDNMGGTAANRLTIATFPTGAVDIGKTAGTETIILTDAQLATYATHRHFVVTEDSTSDGDPSIDANTAIAHENVPVANFSYRLEGRTPEPTWGRTSKATAVAELNQPHLNLPPTMLFTFIVHHGVYPP